MAVEARILGGDDRLNKLGRNLVEIHQNSLFPAKLVGGSAVTGIKDADHRWLPVLEAGDFRDVGSEKVTCKGSSHHREDEQKHADNEDAVSELVRRD